MLTIRDSVRAERPAIHRSIAEDEARVAVTKTAMVTCVAEYSKKQRVRRWDSLEIIEFKDFRKNHEKF